MHYQRMIRRSAFSGKDLIHSAFIAGIRRQAIDCFCWHCNQPALLSGAQPQSLNPQAALSVTSRYSTQFNSGTSCSLIKDYKAGNGLDQQKLQMETLARYNHSTHIFSDKISRAALDKCRRSRADPIAALCAKSLASGT